MVTSVTVRAHVTTICPNTATEDENEVAVSWQPGEHVDAEDIQEIVHGYIGQSCYCEELADDVARVVAGQIDRPVSVTVRQLKGHGVEATAVA